MSIQIVSSIFILTSEMAALPLKHTFSMIVAGPSRAGKSVFVSNLIRNAISVIYPPPDKIFFCYSEWQELYDSLIEHGVQFHRGMINVDSLDPELKNLVIFDDLLNDVDKETEMIFTKKSHHANISVIFITQNIFQKGSNYRTMSLNSSYMVLFKNPRDINQISTFARQMYPRNQSNFLIEAFRDATSAPHGYLLIDLRQETADLLRIRTGLFPKDKQYIYLPKSKPVPFELTLSHESDNVEEA